MKNDYELVTDSSRLAALIDSWRGIPISLDTEFVRTQTYYSRPGLVQLGIGGKITLIDPISISDISMLGPLLSDPATLKILHAGAEDLSLLVQLTGHTPAPLFDSQIAAALVGRGASESYHGLVQALLGIELPKGETRSDWCQRPLRPTQLGYAADDVRYLPGIQGVLAEELSNLGRSEWVREECGYLVEPFPTPSYARARATGKLTRRELAVTSELWAWREHEARSRDLPRARILSDVTLIAIAQASPPHRERLSRIDGISPRLIRKSGDSILKAVEAGKALPEDACPLPVTVPPSHRNLVDSLRQRVRQCAETHGLAPEVIASRRQLEAVVISAIYNRIDRRNPLLNGWRKEVLGPEFRAALESS